MHTTYVNVTNQVTVLKEKFPTLSDFEALQIVARIENTETLRKAFVVSDDDAKPSALEALAIVLGYRPDSSATIVGALSELGESIERIER